MGTLVKYCRLEKRPFEEGMDECHVVTSKFLMQRPDGKYARATEGSVSWPRPQMAKADLVQEDVSTIDWGHRGDKAIR